LFTSEPRVQSDRQTRATRDRASSVPHNSAITDHAVKENHVIDWEGVNVIEREEDRQTRWIKEALCIRKTSNTMNRDTGNFQATHGTD